ncbi:hypothetical protein ISS04_00825 [Candidatus Woesearchaeota archaeon]|nr:hypothetical protein [Candidatus Woesearchaeota archaeon]
MPHQCVRCNTFYEDGAEEILKGCKCGAKLFFYIRKDRLKKVKEETVNLTEKEKKEIEKDVIGMVGGDMPKEKPIVLDLESIKIRKPGQYDLDLVKLFKGEPLIFKLEEGKYVIDIPESFKKLKK